jgi:NTE family protein
MPVFGPPLATFADGNAAAGHGQAAPTADAGRAGSVTRFSSTLRSSIVPRMDSKPRPRIGLVLGSGSARGWAHLGVISALAGHGIRPDLVCGSSIGALVGAAHANGQAAALEAWVTSLTWQDVLRLFDLELQRGLIKGDKLMHLLAERFIDAAFGDLALPFGCVATDLGNGREVWLRSGSVPEAVRASLALPGLFAPLQRAGRWLVDGALVNPIPVSLARAMGADIVIAVDLGKDSSLDEQRDAADDPQPAGVGRLAQMFPFRNHGHALSMLDVMNASIHIMQVRIARSRLAGDPADVILTPHLGQLGLMDFHRGVDAIAAGREAVELGLPLLSRALRR